MTSLTGQHTIENAHYRVTDRSGDRRPRRVVRQGTGPRLSPAPTRVGASASTSTSGSSRTRVASRSSGATSPPQDFGYGRTDTPWQRWTVYDGHRRRSRRSPTAARSITVEVEAAGHPPRPCTYILEIRSTRRLAIDWLLDKVHETGIEAVFVAFPFNLGAPNFRADVNGVPFTPDDDQLNGTVRDWYPVGRWVDVSDGEPRRDVTPLDAPLVHLGGITTGKWARVAGAGRPDAHVVGAAQPLDGQLQGEPGRR